jgi:hypothetical protein
MERWFLGLAQWETLIGAYNHPFETFDDRAAAKRLYHSSSFRESMDRRNKSNLFFFPFVILPILLFFTSFHVGFAIFRLFLCFCISPCLLILVALLYILFLFILEPPVFICFVSQYDTTPF